MAEIVGDCPRCGAKEITFDAHASVLVDRKYDWQRWLEVFCECRKCKKSTIFLLSQRQTALDDIIRKNGPIGFKEALNNYYKIERYISLRDREPKQPPEHVPESIAQIFREGSTCVSVQCWNAAGAMFRKCVDLVTAPLLPTEEAEGLNRKTRRDLAPRLEWLFARGELPDGLKELATSIREDGNDAAHSGFLQEADALDLLDFVEALLERIYTEPKRLEIAKQRRENRRTPKN